MVNNKGNAVFRRPSSSVPAPTPTGAMYTHRMRRVTNHGLKKDFQVETDMRWQDFFPLGISDNDDVLLHWPRTLGQPGSGASMLWRANGQLDLVATPPPCTGNVGAFYLHPTPELRYYVLCYGPSASRLPALSLAVSGTAYPISDCPFSFRTETALSARMVGLLDLITAAPIFRILLPL